MVKIRLNVLSSITFFLIFYCTRSHVYFDLGWELEKNSFTYIMKWNVNECKIGNIFKIYFEFKRTRKKNLSYIPMIT